MDIEDQDPVVNKDTAINVTDNDQERRKIESAPLSSSTFSRRIAFFVEMLRQFWPNVTRACQMSGVGYNEYQELCTDTDFTNALEAIKREKLDHLEGLGLAYAETPKGFMHWIATLRAHRPERWNPDKHVVIEHQLSAERLAEKQANLNRVMAVDAEVIAATTGRAPEPPQLPDLKEKLHPTRPPPDAVDDQPVVEEPINQSTPDLSVVLSDESGPIDRPADIEFNGGVIDNPSEWGLRKRGRPATKKTSAQKNQQGDSRTPTPPPSSPRLKTKGRKV